jgi:predicted ribosomally synthesized peptide with nif11-like leader
MEQMKQFIEKAQSDSELMSKLGVLGKRDAGSDEFAALAAEYGFTVTKEDVEAARRQSRPHHGELSEADLGAVSGGWTYNRWDPNECRDIKRANDRCMGPGTLFCWCDHFRRVTEVNGADRRWHHSCAMGCFNYTYSNIY